MDLGTATIKKVTLRIVPFCMLLMFLNYIDRVNISYAALQMNKDLGFSATVFGFGAGVFFLGYFFFEVPSNLIQERVGARLWFARIMITWGIISTGMAWVVGPNSFYVMRFLLGVAEAGLYPGIFFYFSLWFPVQERAKVLGLFTSVTAIANIIGAPLSTSFVAIDQLFGLRGWQLMFIFEGVPTIIVGFITLWYMTDHPAQATWLDQREKQWLLGQLESERVEKQKIGASTLRECVGDIRVWILAAFMFFNVTCVFGIVFWMPQIIKSFGGLTNVQVGVISAIPFVFAGLAVIFWGRHSDKSRDRRWHLFIGGAVSAAGYALAATALPAAPVLAFVGIALATVGMWATFGVIWAASTDILTGTAAAAGFAIINSLGALGGFSGPYFMGVVKDFTQSFSGGLYGLAVSALLMGLLGLLLRNEIHTQNATEAEALLRA